MIVESHTTEPLKVSRDPTGDEVEVRIEAEVIDPGQPEHYSWNPDHYDPGSGAELGPVTYIAETGRLAPRAHDVVLPPAAVARYWSPASRLRHIDDLRSLAEE